MFVSYVNFYAIATVPAVAPTIVTQATPTVITPVESIPPVVQTIRPQSTLTQIRISSNPQQQQANVNTRKGLMLTVRKKNKKKVQERFVYDFFYFIQREQMLEAQDMFRTANKVTRPEKALILGFMAGSRGECIRNILFCNASVQK